MARKPPPFMRGKNDNDKNENDNGKKAFGGKKAAPFNNRKPPKRGK